MSLGAKQRRVADTLRSEISSGRFSAGAVLPGEHDLAARFAVSRGTVRAALAELALEQYIATRGGVGSVVTFDGAVLDPQRGWARSIAASGATVTTSVLRIEVLHAPVLAADLGLDDARFLAVDRTRAADRLVSLERSRLPYRDAIADVPSRGLVDGSLTATLAAAGLVAASAEQWVDVVPLEDDDAATLGRPTATPFLHSRRTSRAVDGSIVEDVDSLLAPERFRLRMTFGSVR